MLVFVLPKIFLSHSKAFAHPSLKFCFYFSMDITHLPKSTNACGSLDWILLHERTRGDKTQMGWIMCPGRLDCRLMGLPMSVESQYPSVAERQWHQILSMVPLGQEHTLSVEYWTEAGALPTPTSEYHLFLLGWLSWLSVEKPSPQWCNNTVNTTVWKLLNPSISRWVDG